MTMSLRKYYRWLLLLPEPWAVTKVEEGLNGQLVRALLRWPDGAEVPRKVCGKAISIYLWPARWTQLDAFQCYAKPLRTVELCTVRLSGARSRNHECAPWTEAEQSSVNRVPRANIPSKVLRFGTISSSNVVWGSNRRYRKRLFASIRAELNQNDRGEGSDLNAMERISLLQTAKISKHR